MNESVLTLVHHALVDHGDGVVATPAVGAPPITDAMVRALRRRVTGPLDKADTPLRWHHTEGWGAVLDLHQAGCHGDATGLARLLHWCDSQHNGRERGMWEVTHGDRTVTLPLGVTTADVAAGRRSGSPR